MLQIYSVCLHLFLILLAFYMYSLGRRHRAEHQMLREQEKYLRELVSQYAKSADMMEALEESMRLCTKEFQREMEKLIQALEAGDFSEESENYCKSAGNAYFLLFFTLCGTIRSFGDQTYQGLSLFVYNIRYIKEEIRIELLRVTNGNYAFLGLRALTLVPFFCLYPIRRWACGVSVGLQRFYTGSYGFATMTICFVFTVVCTFLVEELHHPSVRKKQHSFESSLLGNAVVAFLLNRHINRHYSYYLRKNEKLKELQGYGNIREFLCRKIVLAAAGMGGMLLFFVLYDFYGYQAKTLTVQWILVFLAGVCGFLWPDMWMIILQNRARQQKVEETLRFETLLLIVMHYAQITVEEILRWMERFSVVFQDAVARALDDFSYQRRDALNRLKEDLAFEPAERLVEHLQACDEITIEQAFYDLEGERAYDMDQYKQEMESMQREKAALARVVAFVPFVLVLALRLIIPFVLEGLGQLSSYQ